MLFTGLGRPKNPPGQGVGNTFLPEQNGSIEVNCSTKASLDAALQANASI